MDSGIIKCKNCGADIDLSTAVNGVIECEYCQSKFTVPKKETNGIALDFLRQGEHDLDTCKFDDAYSAFSKAAENDGQEPEAYWGMAVAEFKVQYIKDTVNKRLQPICHEISDKKFSDNPNYMRAYMKATEKQRKEYEKKAQEIDYIRSEFLKLKQSGSDYDCFICVKVTDEKGDKTEDYKDADYIYNLLQSKDYKPFFSERDIRNKTGADYEAMILYALYTSETMLVVCRNASYLQTPWVKNEYTRFLKLVGDEEKESDSLAIVYYNKPIERLPGRAGKLQGIDFANRSADGLILDFVEKHTPQSRKRREEAAAAKLREQEAQANRLKELEEKFAKTLAEERRKMEEELRAKIEAEYRDKFENNSQTSTFALKASLLVEDYDKSEFKIDDTILVEYTGKKAKAKIPQGITEIGDSAFYDCKSLTSVIIPKGVTSIRDDAFWGCKRLTSIIIPDGVTSIGDNTFYDCNDLVSVTLPKKLTSIGDNAFKNCSQLSGITIPDGVTQIRKSTFDDCYDLWYVTIPASVKSIGEYAFSGCEKLTRISFSGTRQQWYAIRKGSDWDLLTGYYTVRCIDGDIDKRR